jgi:hypothetical protein
MAGLEPKNNSIFQNPKSQIGTVNSESGILVCIFVDIFGRVLGEKLCKSVKILIAQILLMLMGINFAPVVVQIILALYLKVATELAGYWVRVVLAEPTKHKILID